MYFASSAFASASVFPTKFGIWTSFAEFAFNNEISEEIVEIKNKKNKKINNWFNKTFWLSEKEIEKSIKKLKRRKTFLKNKQKKEKDKDEISKIKEELKNIDFIIEKYKR